MKSIIGHLFVVGTLFVSLVCSAQDVGGLVFRSYESIQDRRSSLIIPAAKDKIKLSKYLGVSFQVKSNKGADAFGYVARIIIGDKTSVDIVLSNPGHEKPFFCIIKNNEFLTNIHPQQPVVTDVWSDINLELVVEHDKLAVYENGVRIAQGLSLPLDRSIKICFGANDILGFATTDVPPVIIKNLEISLQKGRVDYTWPLMWPCNTNTIVDSSGRMEAQISNPLWNVDNHIHWKPVRTITFPSIVFPVVDPINGEIYLIDRGSVNKYDPVQDTLYNYNFSPALPTDKLSDQFLYDPVRQQIVLYDFERERGNELSYFDVSTKKWSTEVVRKGLASNTHHSKFYNPIDSSVVQLFGYGFYNYRKDMFKADRDGSVTQTQTPIGARYLAAVGAKDSLLYIYGGAGNENELQEYGTRLYNDLWRYNLRSGEYTNIWEKGVSDQTEVSASSLVVNDDGKSAMALFFSPLKYHSYLVLKSLDLESGATQMLADTISYMFLDTESDADLIFNKISKKYYAVVVSRDADKSFKATIYSIDSPVLTCVVDSGFYGTRRWLTVAIVALVIAILVGGVLMIMVGRKKRNRIKSEQAFAKVSRESVLPTPERKQSPGIYLINGFHVIDNQMCDITGAFTPIMRQLLCLIIINSVEGKKGVSNARLKELLWYDKSDESSRNNRSVHISKIRLLLESVGDFEITNANSYWVINQGESGYCDYLREVSLIRELAAIHEPDKEHLHKALRIASMGMLLPDIMVDWLDGTKAEYSDSIIHLLGHLVDCNLVEDDHNAVIRLSEGILRFDSLDETAVRSKCKAFIALKRNGVARSTFDIFVKDYRQTMGQEYSLSFERFLK